MSHTFFRLVIMKGCGEWLCSTIMLIDESRRTSFVLGHRDSGTPQGLSCKAPIRSFYEIWFISKGSKSN